MANNVKAVASCMVDTLNGTSVLEGEIPKDVCLEVVCENGISEVSDKNKVNLSCNRWMCSLCCALLEWESCSEVILLRCFMSVTVTSRTKYSLAYSKNA